MIVELLKEVIYKGYFEIKKSNANYFTMFISREHGDSFSHSVTREELELISKAIIEELNKGDR